MLFAQSCVDKSYNWDDMDKSGVLNIPPVMLGDIDTIYLHKLPEIVWPEGLPPLPGDIELVLSETISGLFEGNAIQDFFFEGADTVKFETKADVVINQLPNARITLCFNVLNNANNRITGVVIPAQKVVNGKDQALTIAIAPKYMKYMEDAKSLEIIIAIAPGGGPVQTANGDYIFLKSVIVKTGGYRFEL